MAATAVTVGGASSMFRVLVPLEPMPVTLLTTTSSDRIASVPAAASLVGSTHVQERSAPVQVTSGFPATFITTPAGEMPLRGKAPKVTLTGRLATALIEYQLESAAISVVKAEAGTSSNWRDRVGGDTG